MRAVGQEKIFVGFRMAVTQYDEACDIADANDLTLSDVLREAVELFINKQKKAA